MKEKPSNTCTHCTAVDTIEHHFYYCYRTQTFWEYVREWCRQYFQLKIEFGVLDVLLGIPNYNKSLEFFLLNFIILFGKSFIKTCNLKNSDVNFNTFIKNLKYRMNIERYIHHTNSNIYKFLTNVCMTNKLIYFEFL